MLKGKELGAAIDAARVEKGITKAQLAQHFGVKPPSVHGWISKGSIDKNNLFALMQFFSGTVGPDHWGISESEDPHALHTMLRYSQEIEGVDPRLNALVNQLTNDLQSGLLDKDDIQMLSNLALRIAGRNG